jgi:hypothetical protein
MAKRDAAKFLQQLNEQNERIAARKAAEEEAKKKAGADPVRLQRDAERRERLGQLRAREHSSKRPRRSWGSPWGYTDLGPGSGSI